MTKAQKKPAKRRPAAARGRPRGKTRRPPQPAAPVPEAVTPPQEEPIPEAGLDLAVPEPAFAARMPAPEPERSLPSARRAIFFDVENTSRAEHIARVIDHLAVDRMGRRTEFVAVGNWRVIGHDTARLLSHHGAHLVHSAPSTGVRDWSDLRIAVSAGVWLASARPGDIVEIVSDDRAFDAVGDVAAGLGIAFRRLSYRGLTGLPAGEPEAREPASEPRGQRRRRGRRRGGWRAPSAVPSPVPAAVQPPPAMAVVPRPQAVGNGAEPVAEPEGEPHTAPHEEIVAVVHDMVSSAPGRPVTIDSLANALKARGFSRPPGSPRLITRLRRIKELTVNRAGIITLVDSRDSGPRGEYVHRGEPARRAEHGHRPSHGYRGESGHRAEPSHPETPAQRVEALRAESLPAEIPDDEVTDMPLEPEAEQPVVPAEASGGGEEERIQPAGRRPRRRTRRGGRGRRPRRSSAPATT